MEICIRKHSMRMEESVYDKREIYRFVLQLNEFEFRGMAIIRWKTLNTIVAQFPKIIIQLEIASTAMNLSPNMPWHSMVFG